MGLLYRFSSVFTVCHVQDVSMMCPSSDDAKGTLEAVVLFSEAGEFHGLGLYAVEQDLDEGRVVAWVRKFGFLWFDGLLVCQEHGTLATEEPLQRHLGAVLCNGHRNRSSTLTLHVAGHGTSWDLRMTREVILGAKKRYISTYSLSYCLCIFLVAHLSSVIC